MWKQDCKAITCLGMGECTSFQAEIEVPSPYDIIVIQDHLRPTVLGEKVLAHDLVVALNPGLVVLRVGRQVGVEDAERNSLDLKPKSICVWQHAVY